MTLLYHLNGKDMKSESPTSSLLPLTWISLAQMSLVDNIHTVWPRKRKGTILNIKLCLVAF